MAEISNIFQKSDNSQNNFKDKIDTQTKAILNVIQRQKDIENEIDILSQKADLSSTTTSENSKKFFRDIKNLRDDNLEIKRELQSLKNFNRKLLSQLKLFTIKDETKKLEKYINLWNPLGFITKDELNDFKKKQKDELKKIIKEFMN